MSDQFELLAVPAQASASRGYQKLEKAACPAASGANPETADNSVATEEGLVPGGAPSTDGRRFHRVLVASEFNALLAKRAARKYFRMRKWRNPGTTKNKTAR